MSDIGISTFSEESLISYITNNVEKANKIEDINIYYKKIFYYAITYINDIEYDEELKYRFDNILKCYEGYLRLHGNITYTDTGLISIFNYSYTFSDALSMLKDVITINPNDKSAYFLLGICYESKNQYSEAIESYKMSLNLSKEVWTYYWLSRCFYKSNKLNEALECLSEILDNVNGENVNNQYLDIYEFKGLILQKQNKYEEAILNCFDAKKYLELSKTLFDDAKFSSIRLLDKITTDCKKNYEDNDYDTLLVNLLQCFDIYYALGIHDLDFRSYIHYVKVSYETDISDIPFSGMLEYKHCIDYIREILFNKRDYKNLFYVQLKINHLNTLVRFPGYINLTSLVSKLLNDIKTDKFSFAQNKFHEDSMSNLLNSPIIFTSIQDRSIDLIDILDECLEIEPQNKYLFLFDKAKLLQESNFHDYALVCYSLIIDEHFDKNKIDFYLSIDILVDNEYIDIAFKSLDEKLKILNVIYGSESSETVLYLNEMCNMYDKYIQYILKDSSIKYEKMYSQALSYCRRILKCVKSNKELKEIWKLKEEEIFFNYVRTHISIIDCEANFIYDSNSES
ncbi:MAG TPA: tetratricopeptide repeat protein, partial [Peptostreptococcaceae bacterium]|nr:tetratricopeptide repeat protein [Peptostreptococcaceae bacterium]